MRKISRYVLYEFLSFLAYCILAFSVIFILVNLVENADRFIDTNIGIRLVFLYYIFYLPYIIVLTLPVAMLLATMFSLSRLNGDNEITAMKASGISLYRILMPLYIFSLCLGIIMIGFAEYVVPRTNLYREDIENQGRNFKFSFSRTMEMDRNQVFLVNSDKRIIFARGYRSDSKTAQDVFIIEPFNLTSSGQTDEDTTYFGIKSRIDAQYMTFANGMWMLQHAVLRTFTDTGEAIEHYKTLPAPFIMRKPSDFARIDIKPEEMNYFQLRNYIHEVKTKGGDASDWLVDLYLKISFPFISFVIVFFGAPMAAGTVKRGKTASFGIALVIAFLYYTLVNVCHILGRNGVLQPLAAAWLPNGAFFIVGLLMHARARK